MESTHGAANPFASATEPPDEAEPTAADVFFDTLPADSSAPHAADPAEESAYVSFTTPPAPPSAVLPPPPPGPPPAEPDFGGQSFQDLDISTPAVASSSGAPRFESKAVEPGPGSQASAASASSPDLLVTVTNPCMEGQGISSHFTYEVTTKTSLPQYQFGQFSVTRRFRDFDWLHAQLGLKFPGVIVPPLPEKQSATVQTMRVSGVGFSAEWLEERRAQLARFLQRVVCHPSLHTAPDLQTFLEASEETLETWKRSSSEAKPRQQYSPEALLGDVRSGLLSSYARGLGGLLGGEPPSSPALKFAPSVDVPCQQMGNYAAALETQITSVHKHSKKYIDRHRTLAASMTGLGLSLTQLANCESEINASLAKALSQMGLCVDRLSSLYTEQAVKENAAFEEPMKDYIRVLAQAKQAIAARAAALGSYNSAQQQLLQKKDRLERDRKKGGAHVPAAEREVQAAEEQVAFCKGHYEKVAATVDVEMQRFQREKLADFKRMVVGFVQTQLECSQRIQATWQGLLPQLEAIEPPPPPPPPAVGPPPGPPPPLD